MTDPAQIELTVDQKRQLAELAERAGKTWPEVFSEALNSYRPRNGARAAALGARSFYDVMREDGAIGIVQEELPHDLSTNSVHLRGFGRDQRTCLD